MITSLEQWIAVIYVTGSGHKIVLRLSWSWGCDLDDKRWGGGGHTYEMFAFPASLLLSSMPPSAANWQLLLYIIGLTYTDPIRIQGREMTNSALLHRPIPEQDSKF